MWSTIYLNDGRGSSVGASARYGLEGPGIEARLGRDFQRPSRPVPKPPYNGYWGWSGRVVLFTVYPLLAPKLRTGYSYTPASPLCLHQPAMWWPLPLIYVYKREPSWNPGSDTMQPDRPQHGWTANCVIAQQCSSVTFTPNQRVSGYFYHGWSRRSVKLTKSLSRGVTSSFQFSINPRGKTIN